MGRRMWTVEFRCAWEPGEGWYEVHCSHWLPFVPRRGMSFQFGESECTYRAYDVYWSMPLSCWVVLVEFEDPGAWKTAADVRESGWTFDPDDRPPE